MKKEIPAGVSEEEMAEIISLANKICDLIPNEARAGGRGLSALIMSAATVAVSCGMPHAAFDHACSSMFGLMKDRLDQVRNKETEDQRKHLN